MQHDAESLLSKVLARFPVVRQHCNRNIFSQPRADGCSDLSYLSYLSHSIGAAIANRHLKLWRRHFVGASA